MIKNRHLRIFLKIFIGLFYCVYLSMPAMAADDSLRLTKEEQAWIKAHPQITVANETDWPPFDYVEDGEPAGYSIDVARMIARKTGLRLKFVNGYTWQNLMRQFKDGKIDVLPALFVNDERLKYISFSKSYYAQPSVMVVHDKNKDIVKIESLAGKRVAGVKGYSFTTAIKRIMPTATILEVSSMLEGLKAVSLGKADAFIDSIGTVSYLLENNYIPNLRIISDINHADLDAPDIHMGVSKDKIILRNILDKTLASISRKEKRELAKRWFYELAAKEKQSIKLSSKQQEWLSQHSKIRIGIMNAWPPMDYVDTNGKPQGIGVKFIDALNTRFGNRFEIVPGLWKDNFSAIKEKHLDALMDITPRPDREVFVHFTKPYIEVPHVIYTRKGESPKLSLAELNGQTVAVEKGFFIVKVIQKKYPAVRVKEYKTTSDALDALSKNEVDAYVGNRAVASYIIENELITNVIAQGKIKETSSVNAIGIRKDWPILREILQKGLDDISASERSQIINPNPELNKIAELKSKLFKKLTKKERSWLDNKPIVHLGVDSSWPPVEWIDEKGNYQGMTSDYMKVIADMLGLNIAKPEKMIWKEVLSRAKRKEIDVLTAVVSTEERREFLNFTSPYLTFPFVVFTRDDASLVTNLRDVYGKRVGIEDGYSSQEKLQRDHPQLKLTTYKTTKDILYALSVGELDAYIGNLTVAIYLLNKEGLTNIKVAAPTKYSFDLSLGVRKDNPELHSILEKALSMIDEETKNEIRQHWLKLNYKVGLDYALVIKITIAVSVLLVLILFWIYWIQRQKKIISLAKAETEKVNAKLEELNQLKSLFIASVSHELRTPLNAVIGYSSIMMNGLHGELNKEYQEYSERIHKSGEHLLSLITDIIDISKIESGNLDTELEDFDLDDIVDEAVNNLQQLAESKNLIVTSHVAKGILLHTDKRRLFQCILNFVSNAVKYSVEGEVTVTAEEDENNVTCTISDTGVGICEDDMKKLFEPFGRFDSSIKVKTEGTGLGLYLTNKIVTDMLQGEIGATSEFEKGSSFWIRIPRNIADKII